MVNFGEGDAVAWTVGTGMAVVAAAGVASRVAATVSAGVVTA